MSNEINFDTDKFANDLEELMEEAEEDELEQALDLDNIDGIDSDVEQSTKSENDTKVFEDELKQKKPQTDDQAKNTTEYQREKSAGKKGKNPNAIATTTFRDPKTGIDYPILSSHSPYPVIKKILKHNSVTGYTGIINAGMCLVAGSKVVLGNGKIVNIESLGSYHNQDIDIYIQTPSCFVENHGSNISKATKFYKYENQKTIEVITSSGKSIRGTHNHPLLINRGGNTKLIANRKQEWVELKDIKKGDVVESVLNIPDSTGHYKKNIEQERTGFEENFITKISRTVNGLELVHKTSYYGGKYRGVIPTHVTPELAGLMGYVTGDGWVRKDGKSVGFVVNEDEIDIKPKLESFFKNSFDISPYVEKRNPDRYNTTIDSREIKRTQILTYVNYDNKPIAKMLSMLKEKRIPDMVMQSPNNVLSEFISWLYEADGSCINFENKGIRRTTLNLTSINIELLRDVQMALLRFNIRSNIGYRDGRAYSLDILGKKDIGNFIKHIGFQSKKKKEQAKIILNLVQDKRKIKNYGYQDKVVQIIYHDEPVTVYDIEVPKTHAFISNGGIVSHNSGTGKTTWTKFLIHNLHQAMPSVVIDWFEQYDLVNIDNIIHNLTKGVPHIIVFDDASFALDDLPKKEINKLAQVLTRIRHEVKANVITIMNIHYSKAIGKYWRNIPFYFLTSISSEETGSYEDVFGSGAKWKLRDFSYLFHNMMLDGGWKIEIDSWTGKGYQYQTNKPFRIGLASELNRLHFFCYARDSCGICDPDYDTQRIISAPDMVESLIKSYSKNQVRSTLRYYMFTRKGKGDVIDRRVRSLWNTISDLDRKNDVNWDHVADVLDKSLKNKRKKYQSKKDYKDKLNQAVKDATTTNVKRNVQMLDPSLIDSDTPTQSVADDPLEDRSGDYTYADIDEEERMEEEKNQSDIDKARAEARDEKRKKSKDPLDNPMAGAEWAGLDNNDFI